MSRVVRLQLLCLLLLGSLPASAHEFWIEPSTFRPAENSVVRIGLALGERFAGEVVKFDPDRCERFVILGPRGAQPIVGRSGGEVSFARVTSTGTHVVGYRSRGKTHTMEADKFTAYLQEEGLGHIAELRKQRGEADRPGRETYSRCAKSILTVGKPDDGFKKSLDMPLEIFPEQHPSSVQAGQAFRVRLLFQGEPLPGATLVCTARGRPERMLRAVTNAEGVAAFELPAAGVWMVTGIHMFRTTDDKDADWESLWASMTFETGAAQASSPASHPAAAPSGARE